jgi:hypothetical protein
MFSDDFHLQFVHPVLRQVDVHDPVRVLLEVVDDVAEVLPEPVLNRLVFVTDTQKLD